MSLLYTGGFFANRVASQIEASNINYTFESVADMVASTELTSGQSASTNRYYANRAGGGADYEIMTALEYGGTPDEIGLAFTLANGNIAVLSHNMYVFDLQFGFVRDSTTDNGTRVQEFFDAASTIGFHGIFTKGFARSSVDLSIDTTNISVCGPSKEHSGIIIDTSFPSGEFLLTIEDCGRTNGTGTGEQPYTTGNEKSVHLAGFSLLGNRRRSLAHGIHLKGLCDDAYIDVDVRDFKGHGYLIGGTVRESNFGTVHVKRCGNNLSGADDAAVKIVTDGIADGTNNLWFTVFRIVYSRHYALEVVGGSSVRTRKIRISQMFAHGNQQLPASPSVDDNGESWQSGVGLIRIGEDGATGTNVATVHIDRLDAIGIETGVDGVAVYDGSALHVKSLTGSAPSGSWFFHFDGAATSSIKDYERESPSVGSTTNTTANFLKITRMDTTQSKINIAGLAGMAVANSSVSFSGDINHVCDSDAIIGSYHKAAADGSASDTMDGKSIIRDKGIQYPQRITIMPMGSLTADNTNYATIQFRKINSGGGEGALIASVTTRVDAGTAPTGNWTALTPIEVPVAAFTAGNSRIDEGQGILVKITKSGSGVVVPEVTFYVEVSPNLRVI